ncbi:MAG TPA: NADH:ubiquinone oxidoreductase [Stellaceae bacterium]|jgi:Ni,Fe-hydrogenase III small subunit|nr:NADH:ubiquinone oxidoreductase [Stellaceae bacterium]
MANWVLMGLRAGVKTTPYPAQDDHSAGVSPGRPRGAVLDADAAERLVQRCPTGAIAAQVGGVAIEHGRCVHCLRCHPDAEAPVAAWEAGYEWGAYADDVAQARQRLDTAFGRSLNIRFVDAGACGACMSEARQLNNPYYNMHRLGFFTTPTPRNADVLVVAGPVSDAMRGPLLRTWEAMPEPKRVVAIGACAISGGVFGPSFAAAGGAAEIIPVDIVVPGCPPPPLAILHGLLLVVERKPPASLVSDSSGR